MSVVVPPTATTYVRVRTSDYSNAAGSLPGFDTHRGPARGLASVDGRAEGGWAGTADTGGPVGRTVRMTAGHTARLDHGATISANSWRGLAGQAIDTHAANAATGNSIPR